MALFDSELLKRFQYLSLLAHRAGGSSLLSMPRKRLLGGGTETTGTRDYAPGDDYRHIDWIACARGDDLLTRKFDRCEDLHVYILLDCSPSMGHGRPPKFQLARQIAAVLGYLALTSQDRLGVAAFSGRVTADAPPLRHKAGIPRLLGFLDQLRLEGTRTDLTRTAQGFVRQYQRHGPVVVISDLYDREGFQRGLDVLRLGGYEPRVVQIHDPCEADPGLLGDVELCDVESGTSRRVTVTERAVERYRTLLAQFRRSVRGYCAKHGLCCIQIANDTPQDQALMKVISSQLSVVSGPRTEN